jgi:hypothetical protein
VTEVTYYPIACDASQVFDFIVLGIDSGPNA